MVRNNVMKQSMGNWIALVYHQRLKREQINKELDATMKAIGRMTSEEKVLSVSLINEIENLDEFINKVESRLRENRTYLRIEAALDDMADIELGLVKKSRQTLLELSLMLEEYYEERFEIKFDKDIQNYGYNGC
jgi:hypothetical protein